MPVSVRLRGAKPPPQQLLAMPTGLQPHGDREPGPPKPSSPAGQPRQRGDALGRHPPPSSDHERSQNDWFRLRHLRAGHLSTGRRVLLATSESRFLPGSPPEAAQL